MATEEQLEELAKVPNSKQQLVRVVLESPYAGDVVANLDYGRACMADSLGRGEAPLASHLLYTQVGILDDEDGDERARGIAAGFAWGAHANVAAFYVDRGWGPGMRAALLHWLDQGVPCHLRSLQSSIVDYVVSPSMRGLPFHKIKDLVPLNLTAPMTTNDLEEEIGPERVAAIKDAAIGEAISDLREEITKDARKSKGGVVSKQGSPMAFDEDAGETADKVVQKFCDAARGDEQVTPQGLLIPFSAVGLVKQLRNAIAYAGVLIEELKMLDVSVHLEVRHNEGREGVTLNDVTGELDVQAWWRRELDPQHEEPGK